MSKFDRSDVDDLKEVILYDLRLHTSGCTEDCDDSCELDEDDRQHNDTVWAQYYVMRALGRMFYHLDVVR